MKDHADDFKHQLTLRVEGSVSVTQNDDHLLIQSFLSLSNQQARALLSSIAKTRGVAVASTYLLWMVSFWLSLPIFCGLLPEFLILLSIPGSIFPALRILVSSRLIASHLLRCFEFWFLISQLVLLWLGMGFSNRFGIVWAGVTPLLFTTMLSAFFVDGVCACANRKRVIFSVSCGVVFWLLFVIIMNLGLFRAFVNREVSIWGVYSLQSLEFCQNRIIMMSVYMGKHVVFSILKPGRTAMIRVPLLMECSGSSTVHSEQHHPTATPTESTGAVTTPAATHTGAADFGAAASGVTDGNVQLQRLPFCGCHCGEKDHQLTLMDQKKMMTSGLALGGSGVAVGDSAVFDPVHEIPLV